MGFRRVLFRSHASGKGIMPAGAGVTKVFTNLGVLTHQGPGGEFELTSVHEGISVDQVREATGWDLAVADQVTVTTPPPGTETDMRRKRRRAPCREHARPSVEITRGYVS